MLCALWVLALGVSGCFARHFGAYDPVFTPFSADGALNLSAVSSYAAFTSAAGTDTVILGGSTGEWPSMTTQERLDTLAAWRSAIDALPPRTPTKTRPGLRPRPAIMFHVGDVALERAQVLARGAQRLGADSILIVAPCIMRPATMEMLLQVLGIIAGEAPDLPAVYYHYPALYTVDFPVSSLLEAAHHRSPGVPNLIGVKYIDSNTTELMRATQLDEHQFTIITTKLLSGLKNYSTAGGIVYTPGSRLLNRMVEAFDSGNFTGASYWDSRYSLLLKLFKQFGDTKMVARLAASAFWPGLDLGPPRLPLQGVAKEQLARLHSNLEAHGFLDD